MKSITLFFLVISLSMATPFSWAVNVRGRIDIYDENPSFGGNRPMKGVFVEFCTNIEVHCTRAETGYDGIYYVKVPAGTYQIRVNDRPQAIIDIPDVPDFDIAPMPRPRQNFPVIPKQ